MSTHPSFLTEDVCVTSCPTSVALPSRQDGLLLKPCAEPALSSLPLLLLCASPQGLEKPVVQ